jgi:hypothetical protein
LTKTIVSLTEKFSNKDANKDIEEKKPKRSYNKKLNEPLNSFILKNATLTCNGSFILKSKNENIILQMN